MTWKLPSFWSESCWKGIFAPAAGEYTHKNSFQAGWWHPNLHCNWYILVSCCTTIQSIALVHQSSAISSSHHKRRDCHLGWEGWSLKIRGNFFLLFELEQNQEFCVIWNTSEHCVLQAVLKQILDLFKIKSKCSFSEIYLKSITNIFALTSIFSVCNLTKKRQF